MSTNYLAESDKLKEAGRILRGETRLICTIEHLRAVAQLVRVGLGLVNLPQWGSGPTEDFIREARKLIPMCKSHEQASTLQPS